MNQKFRASSRPFPCCMKNPGDGKVQKREVKSFQKFFVRKRGVRRTYKVYFSRMEQLLFSVLTRGGVYRVKAAPRSVKPLFLAMKSIAGRGKAAGAYLLRECPPAPD